MTECDAVSIICMDSDLSRNCSPFMDECSCAVLLWRPLMNTSTQSILEMFSWRHSVTKRWPRKSLDINTGPRESCAALHVWGWASSAETAAGRGAVQTGAPRLSTSAKNNRVRGQRCCKVTAWIHESPGKK